MTARLASSIIGNRRFGAPIEPSISFIESYGLTDIYGYSYSYGGPLNHALYSYGFVGF